MTQKEKRARITLEICYFFVIYAILFYSSYGSYFCAQSRTGRSYAMTTARLALACTAWDVVASCCGLLAESVLKRVSFWSVLLAAFVAGLGFASIPFWIYRGYGVFLFENTWADVSCFFTEGYGMAFPFMVAPALAFATLAREWIIRRILR